MNKIETMEPMEMSKMKQTVLNLQVQVLSFDDNDYKGLTVTAVDKFGIELPMNYRVVSEDRYDLTQLIPDQVEENQSIKEPIKEPIFKKRFIKEEEPKTDISSDIYLFTNKDHDTFLIGSCSKDNLTKLKITISAIDPTFELSETLSDESAKSLNIELEDESISSVFDIANQTNKPQIITIFNNEE